jgi:hypothetical protein
MAKKITISVPDELHAKMAKWRNKLNFSKIFQDAISIEIQKRELYEIKSREDRSLRKIFENGNLETPEGQYAVGKEMGFAYARTSPYPVIKQFEKYAKDWDLQDPEILRKFHNELDIISILKVAGCRIRIKFENGKFKFKAEPLPPDNVILTRSFDKGFMEGITDFIRGVYAGVEDPEWTPERDNNIVLAMI